MPHARPRRTATRSLLALALIVTACGDDGDRPAADDWEPVWVQTEALVPEPGELARDGRDRCGEALGEVRASRQDVLPAPTAALDGPVEAWLAAAEALLFECHGDEDELAEADAELERLAGLVTANLQTTRQ